MCFNLIRLIFLLAVALSLGVGSVSVSAQQSTIDGAKLVEIEELVSVIEDDAKRDRFLGQLRALIAAQHVSTEKKSQRGGVQFLDRISERVDNVSRQLVSAATTVLDIPKYLQWAKDSVVQQDSRTRVLTALGYIILILMAGVLVQWLVGRLLEHPRDAVEARIEDRLWLRLALLVLRTFLDLVPVIAFAGATYGVLAVLDPETITRLITVAIINAGLITKAILVVARLVFAPRVETLRILAIGDETANYAFVWVRRFSYLTIYGFFAINTALLLGMPIASYTVFAKMLGLSIGMLLIMIVVQNRGPVSEIIRGDASGTIGNVRRRIADIWHILLIL